MKKKSLLFLLVVMCIGYFIPMGVFAEGEDVYDVFGTIIVDYSYFVDGNSTDNYNFKLYDKYDELNFTSVVYEDSGKYYYKFNSSVKSSYNRFNCINRFDSYLCHDNAISHNLPRFIPYSDYFVNYGGNSYLSKEIMSDVLNRYHLYGMCSTNDCNYYGYVPLILEEEKSGMRKIIFATFHLYHIYLSSYPIYFYELYLLNKYDEDIFSDVIYYYDYTFKDNIEFMRNAVYDYSDELWEQLNNAPIASSEMNYDESSVLIAGESSNLSKPSIIKFGKHNSLNKDNSDNSNKSIIDKITNPKTWNNGVSVLIISMLVIIGSSMFIIKKRSVKV